MRDAKDNRILKVDPKLYDMINNAVQIGVENGVKKAMIEYDNKKSKSAKIRYDKRLKNTTLLLKNYRTFQEHCENAVYDLVDDIKNSDEDTNVLSMFDKIYDMEADKTIIKSILKSKTRTLTILRHIEKCVEFYKYKAFSSNDTEFQRRVKVIQYLFLDDKPKTYEEIADKEHISTKTVNRDRKKAISELAPLIFGIDGLDLSE